MTNKREHLEAALNDSSFRVEWDEQQAEREVMRSIVEARLAAGLSQKELAERCGMRASNLCRLENGNGNPSVATLAKGSGRIFALALCSHTQKGRPHKEPA